MQERVALRKGEPPIAPQRLRRRRKWRWAWGFAAGAAVLAVGVSLLWRQSLGTPVRVYLATSSELVRTIVASGQVQTPFRIDIGSQITGVVTDVPVSEGQSVKAGDLLVELDATEARSAVDMAEGAVAQAEARLKQMRDVALPQAEQSLRLNQAGLTLAEQAYARAEKLHKDGYATKVTWEEARKNLDVARAQVRTAELQVQSNRPEGMDYVMNETLLSQAKASLVTAKTRLGYTVIVAPRDGTLISRSVERGNVVQAGKVLMLLSPTAETQLVVQIDERNLGLLALGQRALASAEAFPGERFDAELSYINPAIDAQKGSVQVKLRVPRPPAYLLQDMTVSVDIEVMRRKEALVLPADAVRRIGGKDHYVFSVDAAGYVVRKPVRIGAQGGGKLEITEGLSVGDKVVPSSIDVREGMKVKAVLP